MAWVLGRLPYSSIYKTSSRGAGDVLLSLRRLVSMTEEFSSDQISPHYEVSKRIEKTTSHSDGKMGDVPCILEGTSSELNKHLPKIRTNLKLTANILLNNTRENIICSPISLNFVMNMVAVGSKGDTLRQLLSFIGSSSLEEVNIMSSNIMEVASQTSEGGPLISFVNGVWANKRFPLKPSYNEVICNTYKAEVKNVDMAQVVEEVNSWVDKNTKGLIQNILKSVESDTAVLLANALYFKGVWSKEFDKTRTETRDFHLLSGKTASVPFMTSAKKYLYGASHGFKVLKIPYQRGSNDSRNFSMFFVLPNEVYGLGNLLEKINSNPDLLHQDFGLNEGRFDQFWIPKFKFSYEFDARSEMRRLGLTLPFDIDCQDITEMVHTMDGNNVYVSNVIHKAVIEVDEKGTEAAAVTRLRNRTCCYYPHPMDLERYEFVADHPFMFMIKEEMTGAILFVGKVVNPLK